MSSPVARTVRTLLGGGAWIAAAKIVSQLAQLSTFLIAARVLSPAQFGFFAFVSAIAILALVVAEAGWAQFIMARGEDREQFDKIATLSLVSGIVFTALGLSISLASFLYSGEAWIGILLALFSCWMLPASLSAPYEGTLVARGQLRQQAVVVMASEIIGFCITILGLYLDLHTAALIVGKLSVQVFMLGGYAIVVRQVPTIAFSAGFTREILTFSRHIVANRLTALSGSYAGTLAVGSFLGATEAGYYRAAERIVASISELLGEPARALGWLVFRKAHDRGQLGKRPDHTREHFVLALLAVAMPVYLGLMQVSDIAVKFLLGSAWLPAASVVSILCVRQLLLLPGYLTEPLLSVSGYIHKRLPFTLLCTAVTVAATVASAPFGLVALAYAQSLTAGLTFSTALMLQVKFGNMSWRNIVVRSFALIGPPSLALLATVYSLDRLFEHGANSPAVELVMRAGLAGLVYCSALLTSAYFAGLLPSARERKNAD